jgi:hypothetical protein
MKSLKISIFTSLLFLLLQVEINAQSIATKKTEQHVLTVKDKNNHINIENDFLHPPSQAKPLVYWFWMGSNFSKTGITKDLEAMKEMGIGGGIIVNLTSAVEETHAPTLNNPWPNQTYRSPAYWDAMKHAASEAMRLGLEIGIHNAAGYSTTGGPWISEERSMKKIVWRKAIFNSNTNASLIIPKPDAVLNNSAWGRRNLPPMPSTWYKDIAYLAIALKDTALYEKCQDFTAHFDSSGKLVKQLPVGDWMVYRIGYAPTMSTPHPLPEELLNKCQEVDKMSVDHNLFHWNSVFNPIKQHLSPYLGKSFKYMHIDSYESKGQNWTESFQKEFIKLKGYDPLPWLLSFTATVVNSNTSSIQRSRNSSVQTTRFDWDYKDVINRLFYQNGWEVAQKMIHENGMQFSWEPYGDGPFETSEGAKLGDFIMGEFWTTSRTGIRTSVTASARAFGKTTIGAEAFTSRPEYSQWTDDPAFLKPSGDAGFASGANRFVLHQWALQPFDDKYQPGMDMGWWGTHFSRNQTWFKPGKAFIDYLTRCQALLQLGEQVADVLYVGKLDGYGDLISIQDFLFNPPKVVNGKVILASGRTYSYIIVPGDGIMLPEVANQIKQLVKKGAIIVSAKPTSSPSLQNFPSCDSILAKLSSEVWGNSTYQQFGKGYIFSTIKDLMEHKPVSISLSADYAVEKGESKFVPKVVHRKQADSHIFFIVNPSEKSQQFTMSFDVLGLQPELWQAEDANMMNAPIWQEKDKRTQVWLSLKGQESIFVVFRKKSLDKTHALQIETAGSSWKIGLDAYKKPVLFSDTIATAIITEISSKQTTVQSVTPVLIDMNNHWKVAFAPKLDSFFSIQMDTLVDFSKHTTPSIKYFAGTATYTKKITMNSSDIQASAKWVLNLGVVNDLVVVFLNNKKVGTFWYPPYVIDISNFLQKGDNEIKIEVTNNWVNRLIGDEQEPADFEWGNDRGDKGHAMKAYPDWFIKNQPRPSKRKAFSIWYYNRKETPLQPAGLAGPVSLQKIEVIKL